MTAKLAIKARCLDSFGHGCTDTECPLIMSTCGSENKGCKNANSDNLGRVV